MERLPKMIGKDSNGDQVSLLNDEPITQADPRQQDSSNPEKRHSSLLSSLSTSPVDNLPLRRQDSWSTNYGSISPTTPMSALEDQHGFFHSQQNSPNLAHQNTHHSQSSHHPQSSYNQGNSHTALQYPAYPSPINTSPNPFPQGAFPKPPSQSSGLDHMEPGDIPSEGKRFPCRLAVEFNCGKTFTTSGHASRHSRIHTAEKGVECTHPGCDKKFTRSDNMKQHLETHKREKRKSSENGVSKRSHTKTQSRSSRGSSIANHSKERSSMADAENKMNLLALAAESHQPIPTEK